MVAAVELRGMQSLVRVRGALREAGSQSKGLRRELNSSINRETKQTRQKMRAEILAGLPKRGGLALDVQRKTRFTTTTSSTGVRIRVRSQRSIRRMNATGTFRHPVFGNREAWVTQAVGVERGFLDKPFEEAKPDLQRAIAEAIDRVRAQIYRSV